MTDGPASAFEPGDHRAVPLHSEDLRAAAKEKLRPEVWDFVAGGAGRETTVASNRRAFEQWQLQHRVLQGVSAVSPAVEVLGQQLPSPVFTAPIGAQSVFHDVAEVGSAGGAVASGATPMVSTSTTATLEEIAEAVGDATPWFQLYVSRNRELTASLVDRAEAAGYGAIVVTVDTPTVGWRYRDRENAFFPPTDGEPHAFANFFADPALREQLDEPPEADPDAAFDYISSIFPDPTVTWDDLAFIKDHTSLPVLLKGIVHPDDARRALEHDIDGLVVSNHGGRQLDGGIGALRALDRLGPVVDDRVPLILDGGIRSGADVVKALALGATAVSIGRPYIYGLAIDGQAGVEQVLTNILAEFETSMAVCGCESVADVDSTLLVSADRSQDPTG